MSQSRAPTAHLVARTLRCVYYWHTPNAGAIAREHVEMLIKAASEHDTLDHPDEFSMRFAELSRQHAEEMGNSYALIRSEFYNDLNGVRATGFSDWDGADGEFVIRVVLKSTLDNGDPPTYLHAQTRGRLYA
jgi:hypothetical protein